MVAENVLITEGHIEPVRYVDVAFNANGTVSEVLGSEGEQVTEGQVIARLENSESKQAFQSAARGGAHCVERQIHVLCENIPKIELFVEICIMDS